MRDYRCPECGSENIVNFKYLYEQGDLKYAPPKEPEQDPMWFLYLLVCNGLSYFVLSLLKSYNIVFIDDDLYKQSPYLVASYVIGVNSLFFIICSYFLLFKDPEPILKKIYDIVKLIVILAAIPSAIFWGFRWLMNYIGWMDGMSISSNWAWYVYSIMISLSQGLMISLFIDDSKKPAYKNEVKKWYNSYQCKRCGKRFYYEEDEE